jgi:hypothetical protein
MDLFIAILLLLHVYATPDTVNIPEFKDANREKIDQAQRIIDNRQYHYDSDGGVIIDIGVGG